VNTDGAVADADADTAVPRTTFALMPTGGSATLVGRSPGSAARMETPR
jgi:enoyl-CoA hydratase/carnithine racemase